MVDLVLGADGSLSTRQFFRQQRVAVEQQRDEVSRGASQQERQQTDWLASGLERENDCRQQSVGRAGKDRRHSHQRRDAWIDSNRGRYCGDQRSDPGAESGTNGEQRSEHATRRSAGNIDRPGDELEQHQHDQGAANDGARESSDNVRISDAQYARLDDAQHADYERAYCRPPHPMDMESLAQHLESIFNAVGDSGDSHRQESDHGAKHRVERERRIAGLEEVGDRKHGRRSHHGHADGGGNGRSESNGNYRSRPILEQQQLDGKQHRRNRASESSGHTGGGTRGEQGLALVRRDVKMLPDQRSKRATSGDDRPLGAKWATGADRDRRGERFEDGNASGNAALTVENALHHLGNAVTANGRGSVTRHEAHDEPTNDGNKQQQQWAANSPGGLDHRGGHSSIVRQVGGESDEAQK